MSNWELIDFNPDTGMRKYLGDNPDDEDGVLVRYEQDPIALKAILDANKRSQNEDFDRRSNMWHAAHIPIGVMYEWKVKYGVDAWNTSDPDQKKAVRRLLNSDEYRYLRVKNFML